MKTGLDERERLGRIHGYNQGGNSKDPSKQKQRYTHLVLALKCTRSGNGGCPPSNLVNPEHSEPIKSCAHDFFVATGDASMHMAFYMCLGTERIGTCTNAMWNSYRSPGTCPETCAKWVCAITQNFHARA